MLHFCSLVLSLEKNILKIMRKLIALLTVLLFSLATLTQVNASAVTLFQQKPTPHLTKDGKPDKRFKENKPVLRKDGKPDMRYKNSQPAVKPATKLVPAKPAPKKK